MTPLIKPILLNIYPFSIAVNQSYSHNFNSTKKEVRRCRTRGECEKQIAHRQRSTQLREYTLALKHKADVTRSPKQGYQWPHKKQEENVPVCGFFWGVCE